MRRSRLPFRAIDSRLAAPDLSGLEKVIGILSYEGSVDKASVAHRSGVTQAHPPTTEEW